jgi:hypothetical protein
MNRQIWRFIVAGFLILLGGVILLNNLHILPWDVTAMQWFWLLVFGGAGAAFVGVFLSNHENWWAIIPGCTLLGLAVLVSDIIPGEIGGGVFLAAIGLAFWIIYIVRREFWWAIIPGGALATLALVAGLSRVAGDIGGGAIFFLGLAATFLVVYLVPTVDGRMRWAIWPAGVLAVMGGIMTLGASGVMVYVFPVLLIGLGVWLVLRSRK